MFTLSDSDKFYLYPFPTDMRKSFYSLSGIVLNEMHQDIQQGDAFIFVSRFDNTSLDTSITMKAREMPK